MSLESNYARRLSQISRLRQQFLLADDTQKRADLAARIGALYANISRLVEDEERLTKTRIPHNVRRKMLILAYQGFLRQRNLSELHDDIFGVLEGELLSTTPSSRIPRPPLNAEFLLHLLLRHDEHDAIIGDLLEKYSQKHERLGERRANFWFYAEVFWTALPLIKRALFKATGLITLAEFVRRHV